jgi:hypothetical protein
MTQTVAPPSTPCTESIADCRPGNCQIKCALQVVDTLLSTPDAVNGEEVDLLLDLRHELRARDNAEGTLRLFSDLRRRLEQRHYLAFYRLRRWLENHLVAEVKTCQAAEGRIVRVKLDHYCVEAIRRVALCAGLRPGTVLLAPRVRFAFTETPRAEARTPYVQGLATTR